MDDGLGEFREQGHSFAHTVCVGLCLDCEVVGRISS